MFGVFLIKPVSQISLLPRGSISRNIWVQSSQYTTLKSGRVVFKSGGTKIIRYYKIVSI